MPDKSNATPGNNDRFGFTLPRYANKGYQPATGNANSKPTVLPSTGTSVTHPKPDETSPQQAEAENK